MRTIDRKLIVIVIFNSFTDISFLKDFTNIFFYLLLCSGKKNWNALRYSSRWLCLYLLSSKGANKLLLLFITTLGNIQRNFFQSNIFLLELGFSNVSQKLFLVEKCRSFGIISKELVLENYVLEHHTTEKDHAEIFQTVYTSFLCFI